MAAGGSWCFRRGIRGPTGQGTAVFCRDQAVAVSRIHDVVVVAWTSDETLAAPFTVSEAEEDGLRTFSLRVRPLPVPRLETAERVLAS